MILQNNNLKIYLNFDKFVLFDEFIPILIVNDATPPPFPLKSPEPYFPSEHINYFWLKTGLQAFWLYLRF